MKKLILLTILVLINIPLNSYASGACLIKDKSAQVLLDYIKNNRIVVENISNSINEDKNDLSSDNIRNNTNKALTEAEGVFNEVFSFPSYFSYSKYFAIFPIFNEVPYEAKRDYRILEDENKGLMSYLKKINSKGIGGIIVKDPCGGVDGYCDFEEKTVKEILGELVKNSDIILDLYRLTIMGGEQELGGYKFKLVNNNFVLEIKKYYSKEAINACNDEEGGAAYKIKKAIGNIKLLNEEGEYGIQIWKDAWQLLIGNKPDEEAQIEKDELKNYLSSRGVNTDYQDIMQGNLDKYNLEGVSLNNNFFVNTFDLIKSNTTKALKKFKDEELIDFINTYDGINSNVNNVTNSVKEGKNYETKANNGLINNEKISTRTMKLLEDNSVTTKRIQEDITILYENELPFATIGDISTEDLRARIIEAHASLDRSIRTLEKTIPKSQNVCKSQGGGGNCN